MEIRVTGVLTGKYRFTPKVVDPPGWSVIPAGISMTRLRTTGPGPVTVYVKLLNRGFTDKPGPVLVTLRVQRRVPGMLPGLVASTFDWKVVVRNGKGSG